MNLGSWKTNISRWHRWLLLLVGWLPRSFVHFFLLGEFKIFLSQMDAMKRIIHSQQPCADWGRFDWFRHWVHVAGNIRTQRITALVVKGMTCSIHENITWFFNLLASLGLPRSLANSIHLGAYHSHTTFFCFFLFWPEPNHPFFSLYYRGAEVNTSVEGSNFIKFRQTRQSFLGVFLAYKSAREIFQRPLFFWPLVAFFGNINSLKRHSFLHYWPWHSSWWTWWRRLWRQGTFCMETMEGAGLAG